MKNPSYKDVFEVRKFHHLWTNWFSFWIESWFCVKDLCSSFILSFLYFSSLLQIINHYLLFSYNFLYESGYKKRKKKMTQGSILSSVSTQWSLFSNTSLSFNHNFFFFIPMLIRLRQKLWNFHRISVIFSLLSFKDNHSFLSFLLFYVIIFYLSLINI